MFSTAHHRQLEFAIIAADPERADQLRKNLGSTVHYFSDHSSFIDFLGSAPNASEYLVLLTSTKFNSNLPAHINQRVYKYYIYTDDPNDKSYPTFEDACLISRGFILTQCNSGLVSSHLSGDRGMKNAYVRQIMELTKCQIQFIRDLYDELDEEEPYGEQQMDVS